LLGLLVTVSVVLALRFPDIGLAYRISAARQAIRAREFQTAIDTLERAKSRGQFHSRWQYLLACAYRRNGNLRQAEHCLRLASDLGWPKADIDRQRLLLAAQDGRIKEVEPQLRVLISSASDDDVAEEIYEALARGHMRAFQVPDAIKCLSYWSSWQPDNALPHLLLADLHERLDRPATAEAEYRKVLALDPEHSEARIKLAQILIEKLQLDEAAQLFERGLQERPDSSPALLGLADIRRRQGQTDLARSLLHDALTLDQLPEECASALATLGQMAVEERDYSAAVHMLQQSVALHPNFPDSRQSLAAALNALGHDELAKEQRETARNIREQHTQLVTAIQHVAREPNKPDFRCQAGLILLERGLESAGANWLQSALAVDPTHRASHVGLADYYEKMGQTERAAEHRLKAERAPQPDLSAKVDEDR
jgi:tetratricopeptide (TPR) repeat protein